MKKIMISLLCGLLLCTSVFRAVAQDTSKEITDFTSYTIKLDDDRRAASDKKEYYRADTLIRQWLRKYEQLPKNIKPEFKRYEPGMYYNVACYTALQGLTATALTALEKSVALGFSDYGNAVNDTDLESIRKEPRYLAALKVMRARGDMNYILQQSGGYNKKIDKALPAFTYQEANAPDLAAFRTKYKLDSVAGSGDEITRIKNLLLWVHNTVRHDGSTENPEIKNGAALIEICKKENRAVNCRMLATILRDAYQAEGFKTRVVTCMPKDTADSDCHVITSVWSKTMNKWLWMDPTFNAYVSDSEGKLLSIEEVRAMLKADKLKELVLNSDANWNNQNKQTREYYLGYYMSKNLYWIQCAVNSEWDQETNNPGKPLATYINLYPEGYTYIKAPGRMVRQSLQHSTNNPEVFWKKPE